MSQLERFWWPTSGWPAPAPDPVLGDNATRVLLALEEQWATAGRVTVRSLAAELGCSLSKIHGHLVELRAAGLVDWEPRRDGTLRPLLEVVARGQAPR